MNNNIDLFGGIESGLYMICRICGNDIPDNSVFCPVCGGPIVKNDPGEQAESVLPQIDDAMSRYIGVCLIKMQQDGLYQNRGERFEINLSDAERIRAAALASDPDGEIDGFFRETNVGVVPDVNAESGPNGGGYHGLSVSGGSVERYCRNLFGSEADWEKLQTKGKCYLYDAVKYTDSTGSHALLIDSEIESETEQSSLKHRIVKDNDGFVGEVELFWGHWGDQKRYSGEANYHISYELTPDDRSEYGVVISSISIIKQ